MIFTLELGFRSTKSNNFSRESIVIQTEMVKMRSVDARESNDLSCLEDLPLNRTIGLAIVVAVFIAVLALFLWVRHGRVLTTYGSSTRVLRPLEP